MKILFLSSYYPPQTRGGAELSTHYIARGLVARGHEVFVITEGKNSTETLDSVHVRRLPAGLTQKPLFEKRAAKKAAAAIAKAISQETYDIVHAHDFRSALALSHMNVGKTVVTLRDYAAIAGCTNNISADGTTEPGCKGWHEAFTCHRVAEAAFPRNFFRAWQYVYNMPYRSRQLLGFHNQIYISAAQQAEIAKRHSLENKDTAVIYNPLPPEYLKPALARTTAGNIYYIGTVEMYKGVGLLLAAFQRLVKHNPNIHLTIVGDGGERVAYERQVALWGLQYHINFVGKVAWDRLQTYYDRADVVVAPHLWIEPFGRTVVEAMARGAIVVAAKAGGPGEIIQHGHTGWLFERGDRASLQETLQQALRMGRFEAAAMRQDAQKWVAKHLNIDEIARQHEEFYSNIKLGKE